MNVKDLKDKLIELECKGCSDYVVWIDTYYYASMQAGEVDKIDVSHSHQEVELLLNSLL